MVFDFDTDRTYDEQRRDRALALENWTTLPQDAAYERLGAALPQAAAAKFRAFRKSCAKYPEPSAPYEPGYHFAAMRAFTDPGGVLSLAKLAQVDDSWGFTQRTRQIALSATQVVRKCFVHRDEYLGLASITDDVVRGETVIAAPYSEKTLGYIINPQRNLEVDVEVEKLNKDADAIDHRDPRRLVVRGFCSIYWWARMCLPEIMSPDYPHRIYWISEGREEPGVLVGPDYILVNERGERSQPSTLVPTFNVDTSASPRSRRPKRPIREQYLLTAR